MRVFTTFFTLILLTLLTHTSIASEVAIFPASGTIRESLFRRISQCDSSDVSLETLVHNVKVTASDTLPDSLLIYLDTLSQNSALAAKMALFVAESYFSQNDERVSRWIAHFKAKTAASAIPDTAWMPLFKRAEIICAKSRLFSDALYFLTSQMAFEGKKGVNDDLKTRFSAKNKVNTLVELSGRIAEKRKLVRKKHQFAEKLLSEAIEKTIERERKSEDLSLMATQLTSTRSLLASVEAEKGEIISILNENRTIYADQSVREATKKTYGMIGLGLIALICIPVVTISIYRAWLMRTDYRAFCVHLDDLSEKVINRQRMADLGQLSQAVARRIDQPISSIEKLSGELIPLIESIDPSRHDSSQMPQLLKVQKSIHTMIDEGSSAERVVRTMLIHSSSKTELAILDLNELITDCLLLFNQPCVEYAEAVKGIQVHLNRPAFQRIFLSALNHSLLEIEELKSSHANKTPFIRVLTNTADDQVSIRITNNGIAKEYSTDQILLRQLFKNNGKVQVKQESGQGSTFLLTFPVA